MKRFEQFPKTTKCLMCLPLVGALALICIALQMGCASPNPNFNASQPPSASNPPTIPNTTATGIANGIAQVAPLVPTPWGTILAGLGIVVGGVATGIATKANAAKTQLAQSVAAQGPAVAQAVIDHASNSAQAATVFAAVNAALPPDKISTT